MEIFDVIDENDNVIGKASREEVHSDPTLMHRVVHFTLFNDIDKTILITQRSFGKSNDAGKYCFLGEHISSGESYEEAVLRGVEEELGINVDESKFLAKNIFRYDSQTELVKFFVCKVSTNELNFDIAEIEKILWIPVIELEETSLDLSDMTKYWIQNIDWSVL